MDTLLKILLWNIVNFAIIKDLRFCSASVQAGQSASCPFVWTWLTWSMGQTEVINNRLIEEISQTFNEYKVHFKNVNFPVASAAFR